MKNESERIVEEKKATLLRMMRVSFCGEMGVLGGYKKGCCRRRVSDLLF